MTKDSTVHIIVIDLTGLRIIGPFHNEQEAADFGHSNIDHPCWHVADIGEPAPDGTAGEEHVNDPCFVVRVEEPWVA